MIGWADDPAATLLRLVLDKLREDAMAYQLNGQEEACLALLKAATEIEHGEGRGN